MPPLALAFCVHSLSLSCLSLSLSCLPLRCRLSPFLAASELSLSCQAVWKHLSLPVVTVSVRNLLPAKQVRTRAGVGVFVIFLGPGCGPGLLARLRRAAVWPARIGSNNQGEDPSTSDVIEKGPCPVSACAKHPGSGTPAPRCLSLLWQDSVAGCLLPLSLKQPGEGTRVPQEADVSTFHLEPCSIPCPSGQFAPVADQGQENHTLCDACARNCSKTCWNGRQMCTSNS